MAQTDTSINESTQDLVAILDAEGFQPLFQTANPMRVTVRETSKLTKFAVEDGTQRTDHRVIDPVEIDLPILLVEDSRNVFEALRQAWLDGKELIVQTKVRSYPRMMIAEIPHEETPEQGASIPVAVRLQEITVVTPEFGALPPRKVSNKAQASTSKKGNQQTTETSASNKRRASVLHGVFN
ncbi:hypothetical protein KS461_10105 [Pseudomonas chlororaphis]|uniref:phage baseplate protein n=1 Tax=Pseudomonas chlororaphis TaxID=587753 RepID=UPI000F57AADE|nr:hypothetical protein [Pseudomonas chlororaphis]AZD85013.1 hypothetical protein C4K14_2179 [Pseudomonas chlororaphis subsp. aureofaciens]UVE47614.1 hypothetical protein KS461_10105 [Pseudomonas chlororaphis]